MSCDYQATKNNQSAKEPKTYLPDRSKWVQISDLAEYFGYTPISMGNLLKFYGFRSAKGRPTQKAINKNFCKSFQKSEKNLSRYYFWNKEEIILFFIKKGHKLKN